MATYYVDPVNGDDSNSGLTLEDAFASTQKAADTAVAGDEVRLCATGTETPTAPIIFDTNEGSLLNPIRFIGCDANGVPLTTGYYTIDGSSLAGGESLIVWPVVLTWIWYEGIRFTAAPAYNIDSSATSSTSSDNGNKLTRCRVDNAGGSGILWHNGRLLLVNCEIDNNAGNGVGYSVTNRGQFRLIGCKVHDNGWSGVTSRVRISCYRCLFYNNGTAVRMDSGNASAVITDCVIWGNTGDGINMGVDEGNYARIVNNVIGNNGGYGISGVPGSAYEEIDYNHYYNNTSGDTDAGVTPGRFNTSGDPLFNDPANGDFSYDPNSPIRGAGILGSDYGIGLVDLPTPEEVAAAIWSREGRTLTV